MILRRRAGHWSRLDYRRLVVRNGKGAKDSVTILPATLVESLRLYLAKVRLQHDQAIDSRHGGVELPYSLARKYPNAHL